MAVWSGLEYTNARTSIEWAYLTLARYIGEHGFSTIYGDAEWFPYWYEGVPFENTYPPLLHYLVALLATLGQTSAGRAYHLTTGFFFCLGPVGVYLLARRWCGMTMPSLCAALFYSLTSPCSWLMPSIAGDLNGYWLNQRLKALSAYGEGPHLVSLALDRAIERFEWRRAGIAAVACALVPLAIVGSRGWRLAPQALAIGVWAYLLSLRWLHPANLADLQWNAQFVGGSFVMDRWHYLALALLPAVSALIVFELRQRPGTKRIAAAAGFLIPMMAIPLAWEYLRYFFVPQPHRYQLEMDLGFALLLAIGLAAIPRGAVIASIASLALLVFGAMHGRDLDLHIQPLKLEESWEHRITRWMANYDGNGRVYFQGSARFFAGVENDQVQFAGGFANGVRLTSFFIADYGITVYKGDGRLTTTWLKAIGIDYVATGDERSSDPYKAWQSPHQFDVQLTEVWREGGDAIFKLNRASRSLAHAIPRTALIEKAPISYLESDGLERYVSALEGPQSHGGVLTWLSPSRARIDASPRDGDAISLQIAHDPRWKATVDGKQWPIRADGLGQMWIDPRQAGPVVIDLEFRNAKSLFVICTVAWLMLLGALFRSRLSLAFRGRR